MIIELFVGSVVLLVVSILLGVFLDDRMNKRIEKYRKEKLEYWEEEYSKHG